MKRLYFIVVLSVIMTSFQAIGAQTILRLPVSQNPVFEVSINEVDIVMTTPEITIGAEVVIAGGSGVYDYVWRLGGETLSTDAMLRVDKVGDYVLEVTDQCDCRQTVTFHVMSADGVGQIALDDIRQTVVLTADGRVVSVVDGNNADIDKFPAGVYIINYVGRDGKVSVSKINK